MKRLVAAAALASAFWSAPAAAADPLNYDQLKAMVANMGYTPKDLPTTDGTPTTKFEILIVTQNFNVPLGLEITKSGRFIWCTAVLGESKLTGEKALEVLKRAPSIQPTAFWITTKGQLTIGMTIDNREVTPAHMKFVLEKVAADVGSTSDLWQTPAEN